MRVFGKGADAALVACVADGAGSAEHSEIGSESACQSIVECAAAHFEKNQSFADLNAEIVLGWCDVARAAICDHAEANSRPVREYASTLCAAVISAHGSIFFQIGDGAIIVKRHGALGIVFWPQSGEYINTTNFITSPDFREQIQVCATPEGFSDVALLTDGIERLALRFDALTAHQPFFDPLFATLRTALDVEALARDLRHFLQSDSVQSKTDDDKTLVLASRIAADSGGSDRDA